MNASRPLRWTVVIVWLAVCQLAMADQAKPERAEFVTADGVTIVGDYFAPIGEAPAPPAILLHMYKHDRSTWAPLIEPLREAGFAVLAIDMRGHGESTKPESMRLAERVDERDPELFRAMHVDVEAAVKWVRSQPNVDQEKLVLVGASVGCSVAIDCAARMKDVTAVVCLSPGENYLGINSVEHITQTGKTPILLLATEKEREAVDTLSAKAENVTGEIVGEGRVHGTQMFGQIEGVEAKIVAFLKKATFK